MQVVFVPVQMQQRVSQTTQTEQMEERLADREAVSTQTLQLAVV